MKAWRQPPPGGRVARRRALPPQGLRRLPVGRRVLDGGVHGRQVQGETAALVLGALGVDGAAEQVGNLAADGQAQAGFSVRAAGGAIGLLEGTEDVLQVLVRDADAGVAAPEGRGGAAAADGVGQVGGGPVDGFDPQLDMACLGELHRVGEQAAEYLAQPGLVGDQFGRDPRGRDDPELQSFVGAQGAEGGRQAVQQLTQPEALGACTWRHGRAPARASSSFRACSISRFFVSMSRFWLASSAMTGSTTRLAGAAPPRPEETVT